MIDPMTLIMLGLVAVLIFFMFRNSKKRQAQMAQMQSNTRPGAEVMLQSGIYGTIESIDEEENRVTVRSGTTTFVVHRNAIGQVITPADAPEETTETSVLAPDDDPEFGERTKAADAGEIEPEVDVTKISDASAEIGESELPGTTSNEDKGSDKE